MPSNSSDLTFRWKNPSHREDKVLVDYLNVSSRTQKDWNIKTALRAYWLGIAVADGKTDVSVEELRRIQRETIIALSHQIIRVNEALSPHTGLSLLDFTSVLSAVSSNSPMSEPPTENKVTEDDEDWDDWDDEEEEKPKIDVFGFSG